MIYSLESKDKQNKRNKRMALKQKGFTLLELMVALGLSMIVISAVMKLLSSTMFKNNLLLAETEIQETLVYADNRFNFIFKEALSSPCNDLTTMFAPKPGAPSQLKIATIDGMTNRQPMPGIVMHDAAEVAANKIDIEDGEFPMLLVGVSGDPAATTNTEPTNSAGVPYGAAFGIPVGNEYIIVTEISEKNVLVAPNDETLGGVQGGRGKGDLMKSKDSIPTSTMVDGIGSLNVPQIITDCKQATIFIPNGEITANGIPVEATLNFQAEYRPGETIISPVRVNAYYVNDSKTLMKRDLMSTAAEPLVSGIDEIKFTWGVGTPDNASVRAYFSTEEILATADDAFFEANVISVKVNMKASSISTVYNITGGEPLSRTVLRTYTLRNRMQRI